MNGTVSSSPRAAQFSLARSISDCHMARAFSYVASRATSNPSALPLGSASGS